MRNEVEGRVIDVSIQRGTSQKGPWARATVVIEYEDGRYTNKLALDCGSNKAEDFGRLQKGQKGKFYYDVRSREYNGRWYTSAECFDWSVEGQAGPGSGDPI